MAKLCDVCKEDFNFTIVDNIIICDGPCGRCFHGKCVNLAKSSIVAVKKSKNIIWNCDQCLSYTMTNAKAIARLLDGKYTVPHATTVSDSNTNKGTFSF